MTVSDQVKSDTEVLKGASTLCILLPEAFSELCFVIPAIRAIKNSYPSIKITAVCVQAHASFIDLLPEIDIVLSYQPKTSVRQLVSLWQGYISDCEVAIIWSELTVAKVIERLGIKERLGSADSKITNHLTRAIDLEQKPGPVEHRVRYYLNFAAQLGADSYNKVNFTPLSVKSDEGHTKRVIIAPWSNYGVSHHWREDNYQGLIEALTNKHPDIELVVYSELFYSAKEVAKHSLSLGIDVSVEQFLDLQQAAESFREGDVLLAVDSDLAHLAACFGIPAVVMFGANEPRWKRPLGKQSKVIREYVPCSPCYLEKCPIDHRCMNSIGVESVMAELDEFLTPQVVCAGK